MEELKEGWKRVKLSDLMNIIGGGTPKTSIEEYWNGNIPWLSIKDFGGNIKKVYTTEKTITQKGLENSSTKLLEKGELIISARGTVGEIAQLGKQMAFNQSCYGLKANESTSNDFLYYLLKDTIFQIKQNTHGSVFDTITRNTFDTIEVNLPPLETQQKIASILSSLDDKIELNNEMNKTLEEMAQTLFKRWFIDFEFPNENGEPYLSSGGKMVESELGQIPEGWEIKSLLDIADYLNGLAMQKYRPQGKESLRVIKIREMNNGFLLDSDLCCITIPEKYKIENGDILFSWSGTLKLMLWNQEKGGLNQHIFKVTSKKFKKWFIYLWTKFHLNNFIHAAESKATTMGHIKRENLKEAKAIIPIENMILEMDKIMIEILEKIINCNKEIQSLTQLRDTLLPKLMSGEVEV